MQHHILEFELKSGGLFNFFPKIMFFFFRFSSVPSKQCWHLQSTTIHMYGEIILTGTASRLENHEIYLKNDFRKKTTKLK